MIATGGEACPLPLTLDVQAELFPEVMHTRAGRRLHRAGIQTTRQIRRESREFDQRWKLRQNLLAQAETDLNFQSPETVCLVYPVERRVRRGGAGRCILALADAVRVAEELNWLRLGDEPLYAVMYEIPFIVRETPEHIQDAERWQVPNKLRYQQEQNEK